MNTQFPYFINATMILFARINCHKNLGARANAKKKKKKKKKKEVDWFVFKPGLAFM